jgi:hypothetical protein
MLQNTNPYVIQVLDHLKQDPTLANFTIPLWTPPFNRRLEKCRRAHILRVLTSSFGHFKACIQRESFATIDSYMANFPYSTSYSLVSWQKAIDVELLKKLGDYCPERLQTIKLLHTQFNMSNKIIGWKVMRHCEHLVLIAPEQYGSRKHKSASAHAINKV